MSPHSAATLDGIRRWQDWLTARLQPNPVEFHGLSLEPPHDAQWQIDFRSGPERILAVPDYIVRSEPAVFEHVTLGLESYDWPLLLMRSEITGFRVNRNGMLLAMIQQVAGD